MGKYRKFKLYVNGETIDLSEFNYIDAMKMYASVPSSGTDKMLVGIDWTGKEHPIIWTGKCR